MKTRKKNELSCDEARELMFAYLENELDPGLSSKLAAHLMDCPECRDELDECRKMLEELRKVEYPAPDSLHGNVMALIGSTPQEKPSRFRRFIGGGHLTSAIGTVAAACAVITLVLLNRGIIGNASGNVAQDKGDDVLMGAAYNPDGSTETVGALQFSSPMTSADGSPSNDLTIENADQFEYTQAEDKLTSSAVTTTLKKNAISPLAQAVENFIVNDTAVLIIPADSTVGANVGEEIKIAGLEDVNCREYNGEDAPEVMTGLENELQTEGSVSQRFLPVDSFDILIIMNSDPIDDFYIVEIPEEAGTEVAQ